MIGQFCSIRHSTRLAWVCSHGDGNCPRKQVPKYKPISRFCFKGCPQVKVKGRVCQVMVEGPVKLHGKEREHKGVIKGWVRTGAKWLKLCHFTTSRSTNLEDKNISRDKEGHSVIIKNDFLKKKVPFIAIQSYSL